MGCVVVEKPQSAQRAGAAVKALPCHFLKTAGSLRSLEPPISSQKFCKHPNRTSYRSVYIAFSNPPKK